MNRLTGKQIAPYWCYVPEGKSTAQMSAGRLACRARRPIASPATAWLVPLTDPMDEARPRFRPAQTMTTSKYMI
jgi:hypothetical protein